MVYSDGSFDGSKEVNIQVTLLDESLRSDDCNALGYSGCVSYQSRYGVLEGLAVWVLYGSTSGIMLHYDEGIKLGSTDGELLGFTLVIDYCCTLGTYKVNYLGIYDG